MFYVVGGVWESTDFDLISNPEIYGPFEDYDIAEHEWHKRSFTADIDNALHRFKIMRRDGPVGVLKELESEHYGTD